ncbi:MAG: V-type ATP synthase subunit K [Bacilli bacterium]|jgi:V/A-type H+-transporting ATPase subunit K|nr:V-type ATP synthase subunit K [Bacilli bacterium]MDD2681396.1 V-type ATP synthase subunit K [Bacilli bacterium]MDD3120904.1 V-type ATP synthase subunit K [Bacilli bacterium]MDD4063099.1 V-type ATP synthase subunit K [Bacilli bacterium]MDD4481621.1 V-type ATP synthase subunit K [Bacilli bacterium]
MTTGTIIAIIGAALAAILPGIGSVFGVSMGGKAANGVMSEKPELFGRILILEALPGTQGIYGFLAAILLMVQIGLLGGTPLALETAQGWSYFGACMPIAIVGLISAISQGKVAATAIHMTAKQPTASVKGMTLTAMVETYAILTLLVSILLIFGI